MNTNQFVELVLLRLYQLANEHDFSAMFSLADIAGEWGITDYERVIGARDALSNRGYIRAITAGHRVQACITTEGALFVEQGGQTGIIREHQIHPDRFAITIDQSLNIYGSVSSSNVTAHAGSAAQTVTSLPPAIDALLNQMREAISNDPHLSETQRAEAWSDIELIRSEQQRSEPRPSIIQSTLSTLGDISSIASLAIQLSLMGLGR